MSIVLAGVIKSLTSLGVSDHVPGPVSDPAAGHHAGLLNDILSPVGGGPGGRGHSAATQTETGLPEEDNQDVGAGCHSLCCVLAPIECVSSCI